MIKTATIRAMVFAALIAFVSSYIVYFGFTTNYTANAFSPPSFKDQYAHQVYKYRILSQYLLTRLDSALGDRFPSKAAEMRLLLQDNHASERFYYSYYYLNTFFMVLLSIVLVLLVDLDNSINIPKNEKSLIVFLVILLINLTQYVVCPYDISSYFFQLLTIFVFLKYLEKYFFTSLIVICLLLVIATLNRESSALTVSFLILLTLCKGGLSKRSLFSLSPMVLSFLITYYSLRYFIKTPDPKNVTIDFVEFNLNFYINRIGILFWFVFIYFTLAIGNSKENRLLIVAYHIISLPYIWTCFTAGILWEVRLYMPLFLGSLFLAKVDPSSFKIRLSSLLDS